MTRMECFKETVRRLEPITGEAKAEARYMLAYLFQCEFSDLYLHGTQQMTEKETRAWENFVEQRKTGMPLAYVLQERWFMGMPFWVTPDVLIPRQDTELLVETGLELIEKNNLQAVLELCTGSGCVAISLAKYAGKHIDALDIS